MKTSRWLAQKPNHNRSGWMFSHLDFPCRFWPPPSFNPSGQHWLLPRTFPSIWWGQPVFFKPVRLRWEPHMSMRKTCNVYFGLQQEKLSWMYTRDDMSINRLQVAAAHFLFPVSLYVNRLCLLGKCHCCLYPGCLYFPSVPSMFYVPQTPGTAPIESVDRPS